jgi:hypothetical protein
MLRHWEQLTKVRIVVRFERLAKILVAPSFSFPPVNAYRRPSITPCHSHNSPTMVTCKSAGIDSLDEEQAPHRATFDKSIHFNCRCRRVLRSRSLIALRQDRRSSASRSPKCGHRRYLRKWRPIVRGSGESPAGTGRRWRLAHEQKTRDDQGAGAV